MAKYSFAVHLKLGRPNFGTIECLVGRGAVGKLPGHGFSWRVSGGGGAVKSACDEIGCKTRVMEGAGDGT